MDILGEVWGVLENALSQRGRPYQQMFVVSVWFEADETSANEDQQVFFNLVKYINILLALNHPQSLVICSENVHPGWTVGYFLEQLLDVISACKGRSLFLLHYAGHGGLNVNRDLTFYAQVPKVQSSNCTRIINRTLVTPTLSTEKKLEQVDVVIILDSCFSGNVIRATPLANWTVELIAAVSADQLAFGNPSDSARIVNRTFTAKLAREVALRRRGREEKSLVLLDVIATPRSHSNTERLPLFQPLAGSKSIRIPLKLRIGNNSILSRPPRRALGCSESSENATPNLRVIFILHIDWTPNDNDLQSLVDWIIGLDSSLGLELTGVHLSWSTLLTFSALWRVWANLQGLPSFNFVAEVFGENLLLTLACSPFSQVVVPIAQTSLNELKSENVNLYQIRAVKHKAQTGLKESKSENINPHQIRAAEPKAKVEKQWVHRMCIPPPYAYPLIYISRNMYSKKE